MKIGKKETIKSQPLSSLVNNAYARSTFRNVDLVVSLVRDYLSKSDEDFACFIERSALGEFVDYANLVYRKTHNEATGLIVGYYLHDDNRPEKKIILGIKFLEAKGDASGVTCSFSYKDIDFHQEFCESHELLQSIWIHSHPSFGVFYSSVDSDTLRTNFYAPHQMGIVVDIIQNKYLGFKIVNGQQFEMPFYVFNGDECLAQKAFVVKRYMDSKNEIIRESISYKNLKNHKAETEKDNTQSDVSGTSSNNTANTVTEETIDSAMKTNSIPVKHLEERIDRLETKVDTIPLHNNGTKDNGSKILSLFCVLSGVSVAAIILFAWSNIRQDDKINAMQGKICDLEAKFELVDNKLSTIKPVTEEEMAAISKSFVTAIVTATIPKQDDNSFFTGGIIYGMDKDSLVTNGNKLPGQITENGKVKPTMIPELEYGKTYYYAAYLDDSEQIGEVKSFNTNVKTLPVNNVSAVAAIFGVDAEGEPAGEKTYGVIISLTKDVFTDGKDCKFQGNVPTTIRLQADKTYYYTAYVKNAETEIYGEIMEFKTPDR